MRKLRYISEAAQELVSVNLVAEAPVGMAWVCCFDCAGARFVRKRLS